METGNVLNVQYTSQCNHNCLFFEEMTKSGGLLINNKTHQINLNLRYKMIAVSIMKFSMSISKINIWEFYI